jgi:sirohydrochlorin cobaltochelatase
MAMPLIAFASGHGEAPPKKEAILLVVFGTSVPEAMEAFDNIEASVKKAFPKAHVQWAYTSKIIRDKLGKQGKQLDDPIVALGKLLDDNYTHIVAASFHTLPGAEFHDLYQDVAAFRNMSGQYGRRILVSQPLLSSREAMEEAVAAIQKHIPKSRKPEDAVVLMGHGSEHHPGDAVYAALNYWAQQTDPNFMVGTVEGNPNLDDVVAWLKKKGSKKVFLMPFMLVAGDHARNDMCGDEEDSWKSVLTKAGYKVECVLKGTGEMPEIVDIWIKSISKAYSHL